MDGFVTKPLNYRALELSLRKLDRRQFGSTVRASTLTKRPESPRTALFDPEGARQAMDEGAALLTAIQDVYLSAEITVA